MATSRHDTQPEDLVQLYLDDIGRHALLSKDGEVGLAPRMEAGAEAHQELENQGRRRRRATVS